MVSKPSYNPNDIEADWDMLTEDEDNESPLLNRATQGLYPPGSTFKVLTALAYMRENPDYVDYTHNCKGSAEHDGMMIHCSDNRVHGKIDFKVAFAKSCNSSFATIGKELPINNFRNLCESFFFNSTLPARISSNPSVFKLKVGSSGVKEAMQTAIGQGKTLMTPFHNAMIAATIANDGVMMKPYAIDRVEMPTAVLLKDIYLKK